MKEILDRNIESIYNKYYYRKYEVLSHIKRDDFWVILNRRVLDLSSLMKSMNEIPKMADVSALEQLNMFGGTDISELFHKRHENKLEMFNLKSTTEFGKLHELFWWNDPTCIVGGITAQERHICVQNKMRGTQYHLTVCEEDSIYVIQAKFFAAYPESSNANIVWRKAVSTCCPHGHLHLTKTLTENGLKWDPKKEISFIWIFNRNDINVCAHFM